MILIKQQNLFPFNLITVDISDELLNQVISRVTKNKRFVISLRHKHYLTHISNTILVNNQKILSIVIEMYFLSNS